MEFCTYLMSVELFVYVHFVLFCRKYLFGMYIYDGKKIIHITFTKTKNLSDYSNKMWKLMMTKLNQIITTICRMYFNILLILHVIQFFFFRSLFMQKFQLDKVENNGLINTKTHTHTTKDFFCFWNASWNVSHIAFSNISCKCCVKNWNFKQIPFQIFIMNIVEYEIIV